MHAKPVVSNTTPLITFWAIRRLDILQDLFGEILIAPAVHAEFIAYPDSSRRESIQKANWLKLQPLSNPMRTRVFISLDIGEAETLALAEETNAQLVLMDERKGRAYAQRMGLPLSGSFGALLLAKEKHIITAVSPLLHEIQNAGLFIHPNLFHAVLELAVMYLNN